jgi:two-component system alkaline phosphatase synthesis response regulator PhoP
MTRILVIEDNRNLAMGLRNNLEIEGYQVELAADGNAGLERARAGSPDVIILDLMLPGLDGYRVLRALRADGSETPVLILSARGEETDKVLGFRLGADDYVTKPFGLAPREQVGDIEIDTASRTVSRSGEPVSLRPKEYELLIALLRRRGKLASRDELLQEVWGYASEVVSRTVDTHIAELRRKLERNPAAPDYILTVRKAGYRIRA